jgi:hypothetical protein
MLECRRVWLPGVILPVNPSTMRVWKDLQKFDPSDYPSGGVSDPSGLYLHYFRLTVRCADFSVRIDSLLHDDFDWQEHGNDDASDNHSQEQNHNRFQQ